MIPNILFVLADDLGIEQLKLWGRDPTIPDTYPSTPNIDRMCKRGVRFTRFYSEPVCSPTRAAIMTGKHPFRTGIGTLAVKDQKPLLVTETCLPRALQQATGGAYRNAAFGKWHLSTYLNKGDDHPNDVGFEWYQGAMANFEREEDSYYSWRIVENKVARRCNVYEPIQNVNDTLNWIQSATQPWFVYLAFNTVHTPIHRPPPELYNTTKYVLPNPEPVALENQIPYYKAMIEAMDHEFGRLINTMDQSTLARTIVFFVSDNGTSGGLLPAGIPVNHNKGSTYEYGINTPMVVAGPGVNGSGRIENTLCCAPDIFATIIDLAGGNMALVSGGPRDALSFGPLLRSPAGRTARSPGGTVNYAYAEGMVTNGVPNSAVTGPTISGLRAIIGDRYKIVTRNLGLIPQESPAVPSANTDQMFDLYKDQLELTNLLDNGQSSGLPDFDAPDLYFPGVGDGSHLGCVAAYNALKAYYNTLVTSV